MTVGTLVRVKTKIWRAGDIGIIVKVIPPNDVYDTKYSVLFWDERIDTVTAVCLEAIWKYFKSEI